MHSTFSRERARGLSQGRSGTKNGSPWKEGTIEQAGRLDDAAEDLGRTLRDLWRRLPLVTVAEFKSIGRPYRRRDLDQLWSYTHAYFRDPNNGVKRRGDLCALLLVPARTPSLDADAREMGL